MTPTARINLLARACLAAALLTGVGLVVIVVCHIGTWDLADIRRLADPTFAALLLALLLGALTFILGRRVPDTGRSRRLALFSMIAATGGFCGYLFLIVSCNEAGNAGTRLLSLNKLQLIGMAFHSHQDQWHVLPGPAIMASDGRPLLSWRVAILPYIEQDALHKQFHLDEPWDSPHNLPLLDRMPEFYRLPLDSTTPRHLTYYQVIVGPGTACERAGLRFPEDFPDGTSNTILAVEAADAVPWTQPVDLIYDPTGPLPRLGASTPLAFSGFDRKAWRKVVLCDGSSRILPPDLPDSVLRALITRNGGEPVPKD